jgi:hypothetical protein
MSGFALLLLAAAQATGNGPSAEFDTQVCAAMRKYEDDYRSQLPEMVDEVTRLDAMTVDCHARLLTWHRTLMGDPANLRTGWQGRHQIQWNRDVCESETFRTAVRQGWRFVDRYALSARAEEAFEADCRTLGP